MIDRIKGLHAGVGPQAGEFKEKALDAAAVARERWTEGTGLIRNFIIEKPAQALGIALGMGVVLGWLIKRR